LSIKRSYMVILGLVILIAFGYLLFVPRYNEISVLRSEIRERLSNLEVIYDRYVNQKRALEELQKVLKNPPNFDEEPFRGLSITKKRATYEITGDMDGKTFIELMNLLNQSPSVYISKLMVKNLIDIPVVITEVKKSSKIRAGIEVKTMEMVK
jgi:hypothetical protein